MKYKFNCSKAGVKCVVASALMGLSCQFTAVHAETSGASYTPSAEIVKAQDDFRDMGFGIFIHWGLYSMMASGEWVLNYRDLKHDEYKNLAGAFYPSKFDADAWVRDVKASGAKYITITSRHHDGFSLFDSAHTDYDVMDASPFKRDIIKELSEACDKHGIKLHLYYSHLDWGRDDYYPLGRTGRTTGRENHGNWTDYLDFMDSQITELLTNYGPIGAIWFDGLWDMDETPGGMEPEYWRLPQQYAMIHSLQPSCLIGNNHHTTPIEGENIQIFERDKPGENSYGLSGQDVSHLPLETCQTMNSSWGYRMYDHDYKSTEELIRYLVDTAGTDANLLLNVGPRPDGTFPPEAIERLHGIGEWMKTFAPTVQGVRGGIVSKKEWGATTKRDNKLYVHVFDKSLPYVFIPFEKNKLKSVRRFDTGEKIDHSCTREGVVINLKKRPEILDYVIELEFAEKI